MITLYYFNTYSDILCYAILCNAMQYYSEQYFVMLCYTNFAILCYNILCNTILYYTRCPTRPRTGKTSPSLPFLHIAACICLYVCIWARMCACMCVCMRVCMCV